MAAWTRRVAADSDEPSPGRRGRPGRRPQGSGVGGGDLLALTGGQAAESLNALLDRGGDLDAVQVVLSHQRGDLRHGGLGLIEASVPRDRRLHPLGQGVQDLIDLGSSLRLTVSV